MVYCKKKGNKMTKTILIGFLINTFLFASGNLYDLGPAMYGETNFKVDTSVHIRGDSVAKKIKVKACSKKLMEDQGNLFTISAIEYKESEENKMTIQTKRFMTDKYLTTKIIEKTFLNGEVVKKITCIPDCDGNCMGKELDTLNQEIGFKTGNHMACSDDSLREYTYSLEKGENKTANIVKRLSIVQGETITVETSTLNITKSGKINSFSAYVKREDTDISFKAVKIKQKF